MSISIEGQNIRLKIMKRALREPEQRLAEVYREVMVRRLQVKFLESQIEEAVRRGRTSFNSEKFMKEKLRAVEEWSLKILRGGEDPWNITNATSSLRPLPPKSGSG